MLKVIKTQSKAERKITVSIIERKGKVRGVRAPLVLPEGPKPCPAIAPVRAGFLASARWSR